MNIKDVLDRELELINSLSTYIIEIGVISGDSKRDVIESESMDVTNAMLMSIHEHGSPINNLPSRPVLHLTIQWARENLLDNTIDRIMSGIIDNNWKKIDIERELGKLCSRMESYARRLIYDGQHLEPLKYNNPRLVADPKAVPLFATSQLARSITCRWRKKG